jgi:hypothetical protein
MKFEQQQIQFYCRYLFMVFNYCNACIGYRFVQMNAALGVRGLVRHVRSVLVFFHVTPFVWPK